MSVAALVAEVEILRDELERVAPGAAAQARAYAALVSGPRIVLHHAPTYQVQPGSSLLVMWRAPGHALLLTIRLAHPDGLDAEVMVDNTLVLAGPAEGLDTSLPIVPLVHNQGVNVLLRNGTSRPLDPGTLTLFGFPCKQAP